MGLDPRNHGLFSHRAMAAATINAALCQLDERLSGAHLQLARILYAHPEHHFSEDEIVCMYLLRFPLRCADRVRLKLLDLAEEKLVQRIVVDDGNVFYDVNTTPHMHIFDSRRRVLYDAPRTSGVYYV